MAPISDTTPEARAVQFEILGRMSPVERLQMARDLTIAVQELAFAELRRRHPDLPDGELWLKLAVRRLGADVVRKVYGREIDPG